MTMQKSFRQTIAAVFGTVLLIHPAATQELQTSADRKAALNQIGAQQTELSSDEIVNLIGSGLRDRDVQVRVVALRILAARIAGARYSHEKPETSALRALRPDILPLLFDQDPTVRRYSVESLIAVDVIFRATGAELPVQALSTLSDTYNRETTDTIRSTIMQAFANTTGPHPLKTSMFLQGLNDPSTNIQRFAVAGIGRHDISEAASLVGALLASPSGDVRLAAAQALAALGPAAEPSISLLRIAIAVEQSDVVKLTMEATERKLSKQALERKALKK